VQELKVKIVDTDWKNAFLVIRSRHTVEFICKKCLGVQAVFRNGSFVLKAWSFCRHCGYPLPRPDDFPLIPRLRPKVRHSTLRVSGADFGASQNTNTPRGQQGEEVDNTMAGDRNDWKDIKVETYKAGYGKFIEMALRENGTSRGISLANGTFGITKDNAVDESKKIYKNRIFISTDDGVKQWIKATLDKLTTNTF
jgi:hypothetical protein